MSVEVEEDLLRAGEIPSGASVLHVIAKRLGRLLDSNQTKQLSRVAGLSIPEWRVLYILAVRGPMPQRDLIGLTIMDQPQASRVTKTMAAKGLISLERDKEDLRRWNCTITELGSERFNQAEPIMVARKKHLDSAISEDELRHFISLANRIAKRAQSGVPSRDAGANLEG